MALWNPWHGCHKYSAGCKNCYVYRIDEYTKKDASVVYKTCNFDLILKKNRKKEYKIPSGEMVYTCFTSDFFLEDADCFREEIWNMIRLRDDLNYFIITKRIERFMECIPDDWGDGYDNVTVCCTVENQECCDKRLPIYKSLPIKHKEIICEPLLEDIDLSLYLDESIERVLVGGESGKNARQCNYDWVLSIRKQCINKGINFYFKQTGANFVKDKRRYNIPRKEQMIQAKKANINLEYN